MNQLVPVTLFLARWLWRAEDAGERPAPNAARIRQALRERLAAEGWQEVGLHVGEDGTWHYEGFVNVFQAVQEAMRAVDPSIPPGLPAHALDVVGVIRYRWLGNPGLSNEELARSREAYKETLAGGAEQLPAGPAPGAQDAYRQLLAERAASAPAPGKDKDKGFER
jgi:hypothetical protein